jgi:sugar lactone lactonase YvrE
MSANVRFYSKAQLGGLELFIRLGNAEVDFYEHSNLSSQQLYSGSELAPTIIPGTYSGPTWAYLYDPMAGGPSGPPSPDTAGNFVIASVQGSPSAPLSFTITAPAGGGTAAAPVITTIAGSDWHFPAQSLPALSAPMGTITGIATDVAGNIYVTDDSNNLVDRISPDGTLTVVAGNGIKGFSGDGGPATSASLNRAGAGIGLFGVAVDLAGNVYIADTLNSRIRKVSGGIITTVAGNGIPGFSGDGGPATSASLNSASGVAVDSLGNLYIADSTRIRKVSGGIITTVAGDGNLASSGDGGPAINASLVPQGIAVDSSGNIYVADFSTRIRRISQGIITTVAGNGNLGYSGDGGLATNASLNNPYGVAVDLSGNLYIADTNNSRVRKVSGGIITTIAGNGVLSFSGDGGPATNASLGTPFGVAVDSLGNLLIADTNTSEGRIRKVSNGVITTVAGSGGFYFSGDGGSAASASLNHPRSVAADSAGSLYIADYDSAHVRKVAGGIITTVAGNGSIYGPAGDGGIAPNATVIPTGLVVDSNQDLYIADQSHARIAKVSGGIITTVAGNGTSGFSGDGGPAASASLYIPQGVCLDSSGNLYIADAFNARIRKVVSGIITTVAGNGTSGFSGDGSAATSASLTFPTGCAVDSPGNLYIADYNGNRIRKVSGGIITTVAGNGTSGFSGDGGPATGASLNGPSSVAVDSLGNLYIADFIGQRIRKVSDGIITTIAGTGNPNFSGDGGPAASASLNYPWGVAVDLFGNVYIGDSGNNRVRVVLSSAPSFPDLAPFGSLALASSSGGKSVVASLPIASYANAAGSIQVPGMAYTVQISSGTAWLSASPPSGSSPGLLSIKADPSNLPAGQYAGTIVVMMGNANPPIRTIDVQFTVTPGVPPTHFVPVTPCRIADTRNASGPFGGPAIAGGTSRDFVIPSSACGIPSTAAAYSMNVAVVPGGSLGYLTLWPSGQSQPLVATLNSIDGRVKSNAAIVPAGSNGAVSVFATDTTDVILDINGYFVAGGNASALAFYPLTPCRIADTRGPAGPLGGPSLAAKSTQSFPIQASSCGVPASAQAYSLNFAAVPTGPTLGYLTAWPAGQSQPLVASLNDPTGTVLSNAVVVPAGAGGAVSVYTTDATDLVIDINGYFAPQGPGGLSLYTVTPCRVLDSRLPAGTPPFSTTQDVNVTASPCGLPTTAQAFVFNATVVPPGLLGYITMWPQGQSKPLAATLNDYDGTITNNMAIVPTTTGSVSVFPSNPTHLVLDLFGYFAP